MTLSRPTRDVTERDPLGREHVQSWARRWRVSVDDVLETETSFVAYGRRGEQPVALKVAKQQTDESRAGEIAQAFEGEGVVRVYEQADGALLMERLDPGRPLVELSLGGEDDRATDVLADVIAKMRPGAALQTAPTANDWGSAFDRYVASGDDQIARPLVAEARQTYLDLCGSQSHPRLLHGDLHHFNVLFDRRRGWLAVDPKGVIAEVEFEIGAALRNPYNYPELFVDRPTIDRRVGTFVSILGVDRERALAWSFSQAVLAAIWAVEDGLATAVTHSFVALAETILPSR